MDDRVSCDIVVRATKYGHAFALLVPERVIPAHGRDEVLEVWVARGPGEPVPLYTTHLPGYKRAYLDVFQLKAAYGEEFALKGVGKYSMERFAAEYDLGKPKGLENTELVWDGKLAMRMDGTLVELRSAKLRTYQGQVMVDAELGDAGAVKIAKSLKGFAVRLRDHSPVTSVRANEGSVLLTYQRTGHDEQPHVRGVKPGVVTSRSPGVNPWAGKIELLSRPAGIDGCYGIRVSRDARDIVRARLAASNGLDGYKQEKGTIAEEMISCVLSLAGWREVVDHPSDVSQRRMGSNRTGPDSLQEWVSNGTRYLFEFKWWKDFEGAYASAMKQVRRTSKADSVEDLGGAGIGILEWDLKDVCANIHVQIVWVRGD